MKKKIICVGTTLYRIVNRDCHYSPIRGIGRYYTVNKTQLEKFWYFDEMMKVYINIKRNSNLRLHQPFNKRIGLMKRGRTYRTLHHFSFGERFDETMMNIYHFGYQFIILSTHQFIGFSSANKFAGQMDGRKCHYPQAGRSDIRPACCPTSRQGKAYHINEKKRAAYTAGTLTGFWEQKSHSSLGRFLHALLRPC